MRRAVLMMRQAISPRMAMRKRLHQRRWAPCMPGTVALRRGPAIVKRGGEALQPCLGSPPGTQGGALPGSARPDTHPPFHRIGQAHERVRPQRAPEGMPMILRDIAAALAAPFEGDGTIEIARIADPAEAESAAAM